jgi:hypothetical protein
LVALCFFLFQIDFINLDEDFAKDTVDTTLQVPFLKKPKNLKKKAVQFDQSAEFIKDLRKKMECHST